jgi:hypothetical protein
MVTPTLLETTETTIVQKKLESLRGLTKQHEARIKQIKEFVSQPVDPANPVPLFPSLSS